MISEANVMLRMFSLFNDAFLIIILSLSLSLWLTKTKIPYGYNTWSKYFNLDSFWNVYNAYSDTIKYIFL